MEKTNKTNKSNKILKLIYTIILIYITMLLTGIGQKTNFYNISKNVDQLYFYIQELDEYTSSFKKIRIVEGEPHFDELLEIVSKYDYEHLKFGWRYRGRGGVTCTGEDVPQYIIYFLTSNDIFSKTEMCLADTGILTVNKYNFYMESASELVGELVDYSINNNVEFNE